uniref:C2 domain-containing protein n=1 Tax=Panagrellus redivivus TaxID=6233 RepID=A0A7E4UWD7_PANRE
MLDIELFQENKDVLMLYAVSGTIIVIVVVLLAAYTQQRRQRLNWYDQNLLEIATSPPHYVRCKAIPRLDTDDDREFDNEKGQSTYSLECRKQSRIQPIKKPIPPLGDLSDAFTVPKKQPSSSSMFRNPEQSQIDRGLYQTTMDAESGYDEESCGTGGSIKLALSMDTNLGLLTVSLKQAVDLVPKRQDGYPNPYFKVTLDVPESTTPKTQQQSKIYKNTSSPTIEEEFFFQVPNGVLNQCRLEIMVFDYDQFSVDECIGYCWLTLGRVTVSTTNVPTVFFAEVLPFDDDGGHGFGEVLLSLTYLCKAQRLTVNVFKARNLHVDNGSDHLSAVAIRIALVANNEKRLKRKKTSLKKNTANPQFNESLSFGIPKHTLCDSSLEIEAIHEFGTFGMQCKVLGRTELPLHKCKDLWRFIIHEEKSQARWHSLEEP